LSVKSFPAELLELTTLLSADLWTLYGILQLELHSDAKRALAAFTQAEKLSEHNSELYALLAECHRRLGSPQAQIEFYERRHSEVEMERVMELRLPEDWRNKLRLKSSN